MAILQDLISKIEDADLRERIAREVENLTKQKKFGLVFEEHIPECTALYDVPLRVGSNVALKTGYVNDIYAVASISGGAAQCVNKKTKESRTFNLDELVVVTEFGTPIYPYLKSIDSVCNAPDSDLWHTLIEADNYHALQLLEYLYAGKVDCIYIDPPYNTGAKDWKYNNDYVDSSDAYRHSKWLSMMEKRLKLAKKLLNPKDSVLIVTIDEKEYLHLGCLLEELFPDARRQMVTIVTNPFGQERVRELARVEEYAFFLFVGNAGPFPSSDDLLNIREEGDFIENMGVANDELAAPTEKVRWEWLIRGGADALRRNNPGLFYPIFVDVTTRRIVSVGEPLPLEYDRTTIIPPKNCVAVWPIKTNGIEGRWRCSPEYLRDLIKNGYAKVGAYDRVNDRWSILYLSQATMKRIEAGEINILSYGEDGAVILGKVRTKTPQYTIKTVWNRTLHRAGEWGTRYIRTLLPGRTFPYPKSLYAVKDTIRVVTKEKPNALIVDFFAGSGTTLHAVNLLNAEDGGHRRCVMVTNNEVSVDEAKRLSAQGLHPGDEEWEKLGIARYVTWPRTVCSIEGHNVNGEPLKGNYLGSDLPMADGFKANAAYFKLGFLDKTSVALGRQFSELLPILWMKAGAKGPCPVAAGDEPPKMLVLPENGFAVLTDEGAYFQFEEALAGAEGIGTIYFVTDSESAYRSMARGFSGAETYQLYKDYLDNFRINVRR
ncbi:MAG: hypothetical protein LUD72_10435 [Bacteroidales bacterium]|nr:hypothetical protein [Bacteroidales bacterium]